MRRYPLSIVLLASVAGTLLGGCAQRTITITSEPPGALVYLNDEEVGRTPLTVPFTFHGTYDVRLECAPQWVKAATAAEMLKLSLDDVLDLVEMDRLEGRGRGAQAQVRIAYRPMWTKQATEAPWWEWPGPDLVAEAVGARLREEWHFVLAPAGPEDAARLLEHARQMRALTRE